MKFLAISFSLVGAFSTYSFADDFNLNCKILEPLQIELVSLEGWKDQNNECLVKTKIIDGQKKYAFGCTAVVHFQVTVEADSPTECGAMQFFDHTVLAADAEPKTTSKTEGMPVRPWEGKKSALSKVTPVDGTTNRWILEWSDKPGPKKGMKEVGIYTDLPDSAFPLIQSITFKTFVGDREHWGQPIARTLAEQNKWKLEWTFPKEGEIDVQFEKNLKINSPVSGN